MNRGGGRGRLAAIASLEIYFQNNALWLIRVDAVAFVPREKGRPIFLDADRIFVNKGLDRSFDSKFSSPLLKFCQIHSAFAKHAPVKKIVKKQKETIFYSKES